MEYLALVSAMVIAAGLRVLWPACLPWQVPTKLLWKFRLTGMAIMSGGFTLMAITTVYFQ